MGKHLKGATTLHSLLHQIKDLVKDQLKPLSNKINISGGHSKDVQST